MQNEDTIGKVMKEGIWDVSLDSEVETFVEIFAQELPHSRGKPRLPILFYVPWLKGPSAKQT